MNCRSEMEIRRVRRIRGAETLNRKWTKVLTNILTMAAFVLSMLGPGGLLASSQSTASGQRKTEPQKKDGSAAPASAPQQAQSGQPPAQPAPEQEFDVIERDSPFGKQIFRVPKGSVTPAATQAPAQAPAGGSQEAQKPQPSAAATPQQAAPPPVPATPNVPAAVPPAAVPPALQGPDTATVPIALHLENADMLQVVGIIASELKMNYVVDPQVKGTVNINTLGEVRRGDLFPLLQMILRINGATAVQTGNFFRIVPLAGVQRMPLDPTFNSEAANLPQDDRMVLNIIPLKYVSSPDMAKILTPFLSEGGHLMSHDAGNILLVTDSSRSMRRVLELVGMFDTEIFTNQRARLYQIKNSQAEKIAAELKEIFSAYGLSSTAPAIRFVPIERINSILTVTANPGAYPEVEKWLDKLDQPFQESGIRNFIYPVENAKAENLAGVLTTLLLGIPYQPGAGNQAGGAAGAAGAAPSPLPLATMPAVGSMAAQTSPGSPGASHIRIVPDTVNNNLVIQATAQEYEEIKQTLKDLDVVQRQVMIDAKVYEVDLTGALSSGVSAFLQKRSNAERKPLGSFSDAAGAAAISLSLGTLIGRTRELMVFLNAAESHSQARVISAPSILASNNNSAHINVGTQIPVLTSQAIVAGAQAAGSSLFTNTIQNVDTGVILSITPRINSSGLVNMQIEQEVSAPLPSGGGIQSPSIQKRSVSTQVSVEDGETIALGGIIQESRTMEKNRIPLLGDIPYLGALFGNTSISNSKTELIILLTPTVIHNTSEARIATAELRNKLKGLRAIMQNEEDKEKERKKPGNAGPPAAP